MASTSGGHQRTISGSQNEDEQDEDVDGTLNHCIPLLLYLFFFIYILILYPCSFLAALEEDRMRIEQLTVGWDDPTQVSWGESEAESTPPQTSEPPAPSLYKCTALYSYTVS